MSQDKITINDSSMNRRQLLKVGLIASAACLCPLPALARYNLLNSAPRSLSLFNTHTGEKLQQVVYWEGGDYLPDALHSISHLLRDHRSGEVKEIDLATIDLLYALKRKFPVEQPFEIISGYRSPQTNQMLRSASSGVAKRSLHMQGKAIDLRLPGVPLKTLRQAALELKLGGVGFYPKSDFVHIDTGSVRSW